MYADVRARVVTPTCGVRLQCNSHGASSPAARGRGLSTDPRPGPAGVQRAADAGLMPSSAHRRRLAAAVVLVLLALTAPPVAAAGNPVPARMASAVTADSGAAASGWRWPTDTIRIVVAYDAPAHAFAAGHRGIDLLAPAGSPLRAPADGVVVFVGVVVDRGVITIDHGDGHVSSLEPVDALLPRGAHVRAGDVVGLAGAGGHATPGSVHLGVRRHGQYIDPLSLLGRPPRAVLLPCC